MHVGGFEHKERKIKTCIICTAQEFTVKRKRRLFVANRITCMHVEMWNSLHGGLVVQERSKEKKCINFTLAARDYSRLHLR